MSARVASPSGTLVIPTLPTDLLERILLFLSISSLRSFSRVNKEWQKLVYSMKLSFWSRKFRVEREALHKCRKLVPKENIVFLLTSVLFPKVDARVRATTNVRGVITAEVYSNMHAIVYVMTEIHFDSDRIKEILYECAHLICKRLRDYHPRVDRKVLARFVLNIFARIYNYNIPYSGNRMEMHLSESLLRPHTFLRKCRRRLV